MGCEQRDAAVRSSDISVVVQGPVMGNGLTGECLESIRQHLPGAEIILSTWQGTDTSGLAYDLLVESVDPGAVVCHKRLLLYNNVNRQIVSSLAGLKRATRPFAVKVRSDILFTGSGFLNFFGRYPLRCGEMSLLRERVVNCSLYAKNPRRHFPFPFHPGDWFFFGLRDDLLAIWDIPLASEPESSRWFENHSRPDLDLFPHLLLRYLPEQYIWLSFMSKYGSCSIDYPWDVSAGNLELTELSFANNLLFLDPGRIGIRSLKHRLTLDDWGAIYSLGEWELLYRRYCDPSFKASFDPEIAAKNLYQACRLLSPKRFTDYLLAGVLRKDASLLDSWEKASPRSFNLARALHRWLG